MPRKTINSLTLEIAKRDSKIQELENRVKENMDSQKLLTQALKLGYLAKDGEILFKATSLMEYVEKNEGSTNVQVLRLDEENARLYRLVRVALKDPSIQPLPQDGSEMENKYPGRLGY
jgi:hypothetical protein